MRNIIACYHLVSDIRLVLSYYFFGLTTGCASDNDELAHIKQTLPLGGKQDSPVYNFSPEGNFSPQCKGHIFERSLTLRNQRKDVRAPTAVAKCRGSPRREQQRLSPHVVLVGELSTHWQPGHCPAKVGEPSVYFHCCPLQKSRRWN